MEVSKLNNRIDITIKEDLSTKNLFSDSRIDDKDKSEDLRQILIANEEHERLSPLMANINNFDSSKIETLCDPYIERKYTKIVRHKKTTPTPRKLQEIHVNLWRPHDPPSPSRKTYVGLLLDKFTQKS